MPVETRLLESLVPRSRRALYPRRFRRAPSFFRARLPPVRGDRKAQLPPRGSKEKSGDRPAQFLFPAPLPPAATLPEVLPRFAGDEASAFVARAYSPAAPRSRNALRASGIQGAESARRQPPYRFHRVSATRDPVQAGRRGRWSRATWKRQRPRNALRAPFWRAAASLRPDALSDFQSNESSESARSPSSRRSRGRPGCCRRYRPSAP